MEDFLTTHQLNGLKHQTPFFLFDRSRIRGNYKSFRTLFPGAKIHYAMKSNPHPEVLKLLAGEGSGFEIASIPELQLLKDAGVSPAKILFSAPIKAAQDIREAFHEGVKVFACDSAPELHKIAKQAPGAAVYVRVLVDETGSVFSLSEKFGATPSQATKLLQKAKDLELVPYGLTFHVGSQALRAEAWSEAISLLRPIIMELQSVGIKLQMLDIGGGFPHRYNQDVPSLAEISQLIRTAIDKLPYELGLVLEPGRALVANSAILACEVIGKVRRPHAEWLYLNAGTYNALFEAMAFQGSTIYPIKSSAADGPEATFTLGGPTCDSIDTIQKNASLPADIKVGDRVYLYDVGAYTWCFATNFNGFAPPAIYFIN